MRVSVYYISNNVPDAATHKQCSARTHSYNVSNGTQTRTKARMQSQVLRDCAAYVPEYETRTRTSRPTHFPPHTCINLALCERIGGVRSCVRVCVG